MSPRRLAVGSAALLGLLATTAPAKDASPARVLAVPTLRPIARIDPRFQSYNLETAEVIGARFWAPYPPPGAPAGDRYREREPIDLDGNARLRNLAKALGPAYVRVSGTWANSAYFQDDDKPPLKTPPAGFTGVMTRAQWKAAVDFAKAVDAKIVTSFAVSQGTRNPDGSWNPDQARRLLRYTRRIGGSIAAIEPINEPNLGERSALAKTYSAADYARDNAAFRALLKAEAPGVPMVGPSSTGDAGNFLRKAAAAPIATPTLMNHPDAPRFDIFSYHFYTTVSERCIPPMLAAKPEAGLSEAWLAEADRVQDAHAALRDRYAPGAPIWVTEIGQAACGGDRWASTFADTFRYVDNAARLARKGVSAIFHNTLAASDYALIDDRSWQPRPSYWAAVLWRRLMGSVVLDAGAPSEGLHIYAHCLRGRRGGVAVLAVNPSRDASATLRLPASAERYTLTTDSLTSTSVKLNGRQLALVGDRLPPLRPVRENGGSVKLDPASVTYLALPTAHNPACR